MGEIEIDHAGTRKAMPAITDEEATGARGGVEQAAERSTPVPVITSEHAGEVAGEIVAEPTAKITSPAGADKIAAERGMPPIRKPQPGNAKPTELGMPPFRKR